ncbi:MAG: hypothetical protein Q8L36_01805 [bacterium]|nr:hypothetical protein [bacterium]
MAKLKKITTIEQLAETMQKGFVASDNKIEKLAGVMQKGFAASEKISIGLDKKIDNLATITQKEFRGVYERFERIDKRFEKIDGRFDKLELKLDSDFNFLNGRLDLIEREIADIKEKLDKVVYRHELDALQARVEKLEKHLATR